MRKASTTSQGPRQRWAVRVGLVCATGLCWLVLSGCPAVNDTRAKPNGDPLFGEKAVDRPAIGPPSPPQNRAGMGAPAAPTTTAAKSTTGALLLATQPDPLPGARSPLAIDNPNQPTTQTTGGWQAKPGTQPVANGGPGVNLLTPNQPGTQPIPPPTVKLLPVPIAAGPGNDNDMLASLKARGMVWNTQQVIPGGIRFSCGIPNPQNPNDIRAYEATAPDARSAIAAVLQQLN